MNTCGLTALAFVAISFSAIGAGQKTTPPPDVAVYVNDDNVFLGANSMLTRITVRRMFSHIGVRLDWIGGKPPQRSIAPVIIQLRFLDEAPPGISLQTMAYTQPFDSGAPSITVIHKRIVVAAGGPFRAEIVLGHVLAHEICHILQRSNGHSNAGLMKASWNWRDYQDMTSRPLEFTPNDAALIMEGLKYLKSLPANSTGNGSAVVAP